MGVEVPNGFSGGAQTISGQVKVLQNKWVGRGTGFSGILNWVEVHS